MWAKISSLRSKHRCRHVTIYRKPGKIILKNLLRIVFEMAAMTVGTGNNDYLDFGHNRNYGDYSLRLGFRVRFLALVSSTCTLSFLLVVDLSNLPYDESVVATSNSVIPKMIIFIMIIFRTPTSSANSPTFTAGDCAPYRTRWVTPTIHPICSWSGIVHQLQNMSSHS